MSTPAQPLSPDPAVPIIASADGIDDTARADLHDHYHQASGLEDLVQRLQPLAVPDDTKKKLYAAKQLDTSSAKPAIGDAEKGLSVISRMGELDPQLLNVAESHPNVLKALITAATAPEKVQPGATEKGGKGKPSSGDQTTPETAPDVPPTPSGHALVQASDGGLHQIPTINLPKAKIIDPKLQILHIEP